MLITGRGIGIALLIIQAVASFLILIGQWLLGGEPLVIIAGGVACVFSLVLLWAFQRGWALAGPLNVIAVTLLIGLATPSQYVTTGTALIALVPMATALIMARPRWVLGSMLGTLVIFSLRGGPQNNFMNAYIGDLRTLGTVIFLTTAMFLSRLVSETALKQVGEQARQAEQARNDAEQQAAAVAVQAAELTRQNETQRQLLSLVEELETPAVAIDEGVLLMPLIGRLDLRRVNTLTRRLLDQAAEQRTRLVILDIAGVANIDGSVAEGLTQSAQALRLIGCAVMVTGLTAQVAQTLVQRGLQFQGTTTLRSPQEALAVWRMQKRD